MVTNIQNSPHFLNVNVRVHMPEDPSPKVEFDRLDSNYLCILRTSEDEKQPLAYVNMGICID